MTSQKFVARVTLEPDTLVLLNLRGWDVEALTGFGILVGMLEHEDRPAGPGLLG